MSKASVYEVVTDRIVKQLEQGTAPWRRPWVVRGRGDDAMPANLVSKRAYRGTNALLLGMCAPYASRWWLTFNQARAAGGCVRKGEKAWPVVFFKRVTKDESDDGRAFGILRYFSCFNVEQCDGIEVPDAPAPPKPVETIAACEDVVRGYTGPAFPTLRHGGDRACYQPSVDLIRMPHRDQFAKPAHYYATLFHEYGHSTGHESRLKRPGVCDPVQYGSHAYSEEELVAEMASAFLCARVGISPEVEAASASYVAGWLKVLKGDSKLVIKAAAAAQRAVDVVLGEHAKEEAPEAEEAA